MSIKNLERLLTVFARVVGEPLGLSNVTVRIVRATPSELGGSVLIRPYFVPQDSTIVFTDFELRESIELVESYCEGSCTFVECLDGLAFAFSETVRKVFWLFFLDRYKGRERYVKESEIASLLRSIVFADIASGTRVEDVERLLSWTVDRFYALCHTHLDEIVILVRATPEDLRSILDKPGIIELLEPALCSGDESAIRKIGETAGEFVRRLVIRCRKEIDRILNSLLDVNMAFIVQLCRVILPRLLASPTSRSFGKILEKVKGLCSEVLRR